MRETSPTNKNPLIPLRSLPLFFLNLFPLLFSFLAPLPRQLARSLFRSLPMDPPSDLPLSSTRETPSIPMALSIHQVFTSGFTRLSKELSGVLFLGYLLVLISPWTLNYLALVPANTFPFVWNIITAGYLEQSIFGLVSSIFGLLICGKFLEPMWTSREFLKFIIFVNTTTLLGVYVTAVAFFHITKKETFLYIPLSGFHGVLSAFLVAVKQIAPNQDIEVFGCFHLRAEWLPSLFIFMSITISIVTSEAMQYVPFVLYGTFCGWLYLRYIQRLPESNIPGTPANQFALSTFFPRFIRAVIDAFASCLDKLLCGNCSPSREYDDHSDRFFMRIFDTSDASPWREWARALEEGLHNLRNDGASEDMRWVLYT